MGASDDVENPSPSTANAVVTNPHDSVLHSDTKRKLHLALLSTFLVVVFVLSIGLGIGLQDNPSNNVDNGEGDEGDTRPQVNSNETETREEVASFLKSPGPIQARIRLASPTIANGYTSCTDLKDDIRNALKHLANTIIMEQSKNGAWYETNCDGGHPDFITDDSYHIDDIIPSTPTLYQESDMAFEGDASAFLAKDPIREDSFETNNQVQGVDEADFVKSNGKHVFAAYGDVLFSWDANDAKKGLSITRMPYNATDKKDCPYYKPEPFDVMAIEDDTFEFLVDEDHEEEQELFELIEEVSEEVLSTPPAGNRKTTMISDSMIIPPCYKPKPQILSLLLRGSRLTAIVSDESSHYFSPFATEEESSTLLDYQDLTIKVYDAENVPSDGSPLRLLGEKKIKGNYHDARSIDSHDIVITTSNVNIDSFTSKLYRYRPEYCGLNSTEYEAVATEIALNETEAFMERFVNDLELELDGNCAGIFQLASIQTGDSTEVYDSNLLDHFVRVLTFDSNMSTNQLMNDFTISSSGTFAPGWPNSIYVSQGFAGVVNVGHDYNPITNGWDEYTFISGFDISGISPKPFAFGRAPGRPLNKFAFDLYNGHLRVATTTTDWFNTDSTTDNQIFVFQIPEEGQGREMKLVGATGHLGKKNEHITAVRFKGDRAYVVTFEQIDPFYIVDMGNHTNPKVLGELSLPGFSQYLHELELDGKKYMLGLGRLDEAVKIGLFDISDEKNPIQSAFHLEKQAYSSAGSDSLAFRFLPVSKLLIIPKSEWTWTAEGNFDGFVVYSVNSTHITPVYEIQHADSQSIYRGCWYNAYMQARSLVFQSKLTTLLSHSVISTDLENGETLFDLNLDEALNNTECYGYFY